MQEVQITVLLPDTAPLLLRQDENLKVGPPLPRPSPMDISYLPVDTGHVSVSQEAGIYWPVTNAVYRVLQVGAFPIQTRLNPSLRVVLERSVCVRLVVQGARTVSSASGAFTSGGLRCVSQEELPGAALVGRRVRYVNLTQGVLTLLRVC